MAMLTTTATMTMMMMMMMMMMMLPIPKEFDSSPSTSDTQIMIQMSCRRAGDAPHGYAGLRSSQLLTAGRCTCCDLQIAEAVQAAELCGDIDIVTLMILMPH